MIKAIIFDWDDVIVTGSTEWYVKCYHETLAQLGVHLEEKEERRRIFENWGKVLEYVVPDVTKIKEVLEAINEK